VFAWDQLEHSRCPASALLSGEKLQAEVSRTAAGKLRSIMFERTVRGRATMETLPSMATFLYQKMSCIGYTRIPTWCLQCAHPRSSISESQTSMMDTRWACRWALDRSKRNQPPQKSAASIGSFVVPFPPANRFGFLQRGFAANERACERFTQSMQKAWKHLPTDTLEVGNDSSHHAAHVVAFNPPTLNRTIARTLGPQCVCV